MTALDEVGDELISMRTRIGSSGPWYGNGETSTTSWYCFTVPFLLRFYHSLLASEAHVVGFREWTFVLAGGHPPRSERLSIGLLGPLSVTVGDGEVVISGARRRRRVDPPGAERRPSVGVGPALESVWEGDAPAGAANSLQAHVGYLRRQLGGVGC